MKLTVLCSLLGLFALANAGESVSRKTTQPNVSPLFDRCVEIANQPLFDFPISREVGVSINYEWEPPKPTDTQVFSFLIAMEAGHR
ncbi:hypothetical protein Pla52o_50050 [Novipirellula galeiformis]|uniref:Uncharacterized protein n=1 Tax=Novipirellula galeiformis TaxID=2528004 RepID=A0A5C6BZK4_9BACT|nr:hypothetical protein Pla52o_50050 [Novipirellula galeiformis]